MRKGGHHVSKKNERVGQPRRDGLRKPENPSRKNKKEVAGAGGNHLHKKVILNYRKNQEFVDFLKFERA